MSVREVTETSETFGANCCKSGRLMLGSQGLMWMPKTIWRDGDQSLMRMLMTRDCNCNPQSNAIVTGSALRTQKLMSEWNWNFPRKSHYLRAFFHGKLTFLNCNRSSCSSNHSKTMLYIRVLQELPRARASRDEALLSVVAAPCSGHGRVRGFVTGCSSENN